MPDYHEKYRRYEDDELQAAISQLSAEVGGGKRHIADELFAAQEIAEERNLFY